jgi:hypothetical protein
VRPGPRGAAALAVLAFSIAYFWLISHQSLVFARYAMPIVPMMCLGIALAIDGVQKWFRWPRAALALTLLLALQPATQALASDVDRRLVGTEELMARWIETNLPPQDPIAIESPRIRLRPRAGKVEYVTRLIAVPLESYRANGVAYLISSSAMEDVFFNNPEAHAPQVNAYRQLFAATQMVHVLLPSADHPGPRLVVYKIPK